MLSVGMTLPPRAVKAFELSAYRRLAAGVGALRHEPRELTGWHTSDTQAHRCPRHP